ncbi:MAG: hypothetical protein Q4B48_06830 [Syntrophomonadaceae bacterium]|nr:hypothetical protein [Syntrophomonadaceae bacterium]
MDPNQEDSGIQTQDGHDLGTFNFLRAGWWVAHVIFIAVVFYIGWMFGAGTL